MRRLAFIFAVAASSLWAADPQLLNLVPPEAKVLAGINVQQAKTSPFGQYVLRQFVREDARFARFVEASGFDPRRDIREILVASTGEPKSTLLLMTGSFDAGRFNQVLTRVGGRQEVYKDLTIVVSRRGTEALAILDSNTAIGGPVESVKAAIDRRQTSAILHPDLAVRVNQWSTSQDAWVVSDHIPTLANAPAEAFQKIERANAGVKFGSVVTVTGEAVAQTSGDAKALADVVRLFATLASVQAAQRNPDAASVLKTLNVTAQDRTINISLTIPEDQLEQLIRSPQHRRPASAPARYRSVPAPAL